MSMLARRAAQQSDAKAVGQNAGQVAQRGKAKVEDDFCLEVIYRLEGDLIRYDSRRELLQIARDRKIHLFRANMLMAQIVEAVRQHKLYEPAPAEMRLKQPARKQRSVIKRLILTMAVVLAVIADVLLIRWFGR